MIDTTVGWSEGLGACACMVGSSSPGAARLAGGGRGRGRRRRRPAARQRVVVELDDEDEDEDGVEGLGDASGRASFGLARDRFKRALAANDARLMDSALREARFFFARLTESEKLAVKDDLAYIEDLAANRGTAREEAKVSAQRREVAAKRVAQDKAKGSPSWAPFFGEALREEVARREEQARGFFGHPGVKIVGGLLALAAIGYGVSRLWPGGSR